MNFNIVKGSKRTRVQNAAAAGTTTLNTTVVDMQGFESIVWDALFGALTATQVTSIKAQGGLLSDGSDMADLAGTSTGPLADADSNKGLTLELVRPTFRYVRLVIVRGTANAVVDGAIATQYHSHKVPETDDTTVKANKTVVGAAAGTA